MVGSAKGRSIRTSRILLPGKESRTRTQAIRVPEDRLIRPTSRLAMIVSLSADQASGVVTAPQNSCQPPFVPV